VKTPIILNCLEILLHHAYLTCINVTTVNMYPNLTHVMVTLTVVIILTKYIVVSKTMTSFFFWCDVIGF